MTFKDAMTVEEASAYLALDEATLARMAEARQIPAVKVDKQWVFSRKSLQKWQRLQARRTASA
ncbi:MAG: helix-turn-helix domain-containing protein [Candidatus Rokubacteria bacterium]|nr:helix-turn-helix domain-containing protein [Candidatus Rokubacteria bacterium]